MPPLVDRFVKYLKKNTHISEEWGKSVTVTKQKLWSLAIEHGYRSDTIKKALKDLEEVPYIGSWWDGKKRQVEFMYYEMTDEEIRQKEESDAWFNEL